MISERQCPSGFAKPHSPLYPAIDALEDIAVVELDPDALGRIGLEGSELFAEPAGGCTRDGLGADAG